MDGPTTQVYLNPQIDPWWTSRLNWLMEYLPNELMELWNTPNHQELLEDLDRSVAMADKIREMFDGHLEDVIEEFVAEGICPAEMDFPDEPLPDEVMDEILTWASSIKEQEDREVEITL